MNKTISVFGDLTALYAARSGCNPGRIRRSINYSQLNSGLLAAMDVEKWDTNVWYTLYSAKNAEQTSFVKGLEEFGWNVEKYQSKEVRYHEHTVDYRFDAQLAYQIATADTDNIVIVSDSLDLLPVIKAAKEDDPNLNITLAFFSEAMDRGWWKALKDESRCFDFIELDDVLYENE
jgi:hypothetical protein